VTHDNRAFELYRLALTLVEAKGVNITVGLTSMKEYRGEGLTIRHMPSLARLDVWYRRKALAIDRQHGQMRVYLYMPGEWEDVLEKLATKPLEN
jgi:hypothetical protein